MSEDNYSQSRAAYCTPEVNGQDFEPMPHPSRRYEHIRLNEEDAMKWNQDYDVNRGTDKFSLAKIKAALEKEAREELSDWLGWES